MHRSRLSEKEFIITFFSLLAGVFSVVFGGYYIAHGDAQNSLIFATIFVVNLTNYVVFKRTHREIPALIVLISFGLPVLVPWQINGGVDGTGIFAYHVYAVWVFFLLGRRLGLVLIAFFMLISIGEYALQEMGYLNAPYTVGTMLTFYFGLSLEVALLWLFDAAKDRAERTLEDERAKLQAIFDNMAEGLVVSGRDGKFSYFNKAAEEMLGVGMSQEDPSQWQKEYGLFRADRVTPFPQAEFPIVKAARGEKTSAEMYVKNAQLKKGIIIELNGSPLVDGHGKIVGGIVVFNDVTSEREAKQKVKIEKAKAEAILGSIGDGVFAIDPGGRIILFNDAAGILSGVTAEQALGKPYKEVLDFQNEKDDSSVDGFIVSALWGKKAEMAAHTALKRQDGTTIPVADSAAPIVNVDGGIEGAVVVFRDTTKERQLERMKDEFLSIASHELRTPMGAVRANISMILDGDYGPVNDGLVEPLNDMRASTVHLVELVSDLLNVARIEAGRVKFTLGDVDLEQTLREVIASLVPLGKEKGVPITLEATEPIKVQADVEKIKQVVTNLVGNSLKFTDQGSISLAVNRANTMAEVTVTDTGIGITHSDQQKLFDKFQQISSAQNGKPAGTGLGLYISREIIRKMGGEMWIKRSEPGKGSTFAFTIPLAGSAEASYIKNVLTKEATDHPDQK